MHSYDTKQSASDSLATYGVYKYVLLDLSLQQFRRTMFNLYVK